MKLKEVCEKTGLTQKTIRFYEEKQLISPASTVKNDRSYREYSESDVKALQEIAILRKALFSLEEIYQMQQDPDEIEAIVSHYAQRVTTMASTLTALSETINRLDISALTDISTLAQAMDPAAKVLPLPAYDIEPKFKYIDELELAELEQDKIIQQNKQGESPFILEQQKFTDRLGLFNQYYHHNGALTGGTHNLPKPQEPKLLRIVNLIISSAILLCALVIFYFLLQHKIELVYLWDHIKYWLIPLELFAIAIRLMTGRFYQLFSERRHTGTFNKKQFLKYCGILIILFAILGGGALLLKPANVSENHDFTIVIVCSQTIPPEKIEELEQSFIPTTYYKGTDRIHIVALNSLDSVDLQELRNRISLGAYPLFFVDQPTYDGVIQDMLSRDELELCALPGIIQSDRSPALCDISTASFLADIGLEGQTIYGFVLENAFNEDLAIEFLKEIYSTIYVDNSK